MAPQTPDTDSCISEALIQLTADLQEPPPPDRGALRERDARSAGIAFADYLRHYPYIERHTQFGYYTQFQEAEKFVRALSQAINEVYADDAVCLLYTPKDPNHAYYSDNYFGSRVFFDAVSQALHEDPAVNTSSRALDAIKNIDSLRFLLALDAIKNIDSLIVLRQEEEIARCVIHLIENRCFFRHTQKVDRRTPPLRDIADLLVYIAHTCDVIEKNDVLRAIRAHVNAHSREFAIRRMSE